MSKIQTNHKFTIILHVTTHKIVQWGMTVLHKNIWRIIIIIENASKRAYACVLNLSSSLTHSNQSTHLAELKKREWGQHKQPPHKSNSNQSHVENSRREAQMQEQLEKQKQLG